MSAVRDLTVRLMFHRDLRHVLAIEQRKSGPCWSRLDFSPVFHCGQTTGWVAEVDDAVVGHLVFRSGPHGFTLLNLAVAPYWRRQGVARAMLKKLDEKRPPCIEAAVPESNLPAQLLLRSAGYRAVQVLREHFGEEDGYLMERRPGVPPE
jgi:ribosomal-protein-alanine N-acetyltransferase